MSDSDTSEISGINESHEKPNSELEFVATFVKEHAIIIDKGKTPSITQRKNASLKLLVEEFQKKFGKPTNVKKLLKQINNLKTAVKFSLLETAMQHAMQGDNSGSNPVLKKLDGKIAVESSTSTSEFLPSMPKRPPSPTPQLRKHSILNKYETDETKKLTNAELQRLVLLEELQLVHLKKKKLQNELQTQEIVLESEKSYTNL
ncbi:hypothetical protein ABEB36_010683 [Hypothenemus hampei]|uniref:Uncharacterized protein n=1 Tax=Hypothenemus hampei TaxID=57062 RepID=A0ABD1EH13_HYPHA